MVKIELEINRLKIKIANGQANLTKLFIQHLPLLFNYFKIKLPFHIRLIILVRKR